MNIVAPYVLEAIRQFDHEQSSLKLVRIPSKWETSIMVVDPDIEYDVIVWLHGETKYNGAHAVVIHPRHGHWCVNLNGSSHRNIGKVYRVRSLEQMRRDVEQGHTKLLWPDVPELGV